MTDAEPTPARPRPRRTWPGLACLTPLWFVWHRRYVEVVVVWLILFGTAWRAIEASHGYVRSDALRIPTLGIVSNLLAAIPQPDLGSSNAGLMVLLLMALQGSWATWLARRRPLPANWPVSTAGTIVALALGYWALTGLRVPGTKPKAYIYAMTAELREVAATEDSLFEEQGRYLATRDTIPVAGVTIRLSTTDSGWSAIASHQASPVQCGAFGGRALPPVAGAVPGTPACVMASRHIPWARLDYVDLQKDELRRLVAVQDSFHASTRRYAGSLGELHFQSTPGVQIEFLTLYGDSGWSAIAYHVAARTKCGVAGGSGINPVAHTAPGRLKCRAR